MTRDVARPDELDALEQIIDDWFQRQQKELPILLDVARDEDIERRWYARLEGKNVMSPPCGSPSVKEL